MPIFPKSAPHPHGSPRVAKDNALPSYLGCFTKVSRDLKNSSRNLCIAEIELLMKISSWNMYKVLAWNSHHKCDFWHCIFSRDFWRTHETLGTQPLGQKTSDQYRFRKYSDVIWASSCVKSPTTRLFVHQREHQLIQSPLWDADDLRIKDEHRVYSQRS